MIDYEALAREAVGNWRTFMSFSWHRQYELNDPENFAIVYTSNRDSGLLDQPNADAIGEELEP